MRRSAKQSHFWEVKEKYRKWKGTRYFRINWDAKEVVQVCVSPGEEKKGRGNIFGVYTISLVTMFGNFMGPGYVDPITKEKFDENFDEVVKFLRT